MTSLKRIAAACLLVALAIHVSACSSRDNKRSPSATTLPDATVARSGPGLQEDLVWQTRLARAREYASGRDWVEVVKILEQPTMQSTRPPAEAADLLAQAFVDLGRIEDAHIALRHGLRATPDSPLLQDSQANLHYVTGKVKLDEGLYTAARSEFEQAISAAPQGQRHIHERIAGAYRGAARDLQVSGDHERAIGVLRDSLDLDPDNPGSIKMLGGILKNIGRLQDAIAFHELYLMYEQADEQMRQDLLGLYRATGAEEKARKLMAGTLPVGQAGATIPGATESPETQSQAELEMQVTLAQDDLTRASVYERWGRIAAAERDYRTAASRLRQSLELNPGSENAAMALAEVHRLDRKPELARQVYEELLTRNPTAHKARFQLAKLLVTSRLPRQALTHFQQLVTEPSIERSLMLDSYNWLGITHAQLGDYVSAREVWDELLRIYPQHANAHYNQGQILEKQKRYKDAIVAFEKAVDYGESDPDLFRYLERLGLSYRQVGDNQKALEVWKRVAQSAPKGSPYAVKARQFLSRHETQLGSRLDPETGQVVQDSQPARPETPGGWRRQETPPPEEEPPPLEAALTTTSGPSPGSEPWHLAEAERAIREGQYDRAIGEYERVLALNPVNAQSYFKLGDLLHQKGDLKAERDLFRRMMQQPLPPNLLQAASFRLQGLETP